MEISRLKEINDVLDFNERLLGIYSGAKVDTISRAKNETYGVEFYGQSFSPGDKAQLLEHLIENYPSYNRTERAVIFLKSRIEDAVVKEDVEELLTFSYQVILDKFPSISSSSNPMASLDENLAPWTWDTYRPNLQLLARLINAIYLSRWSEEQHKRFDSTFSLLEDYSLFFLSYTRNMCQPENTKFKVALEELFRDRIAEFNSNWSTVNYMAKLIEFIFKLNNWRKYFFDETSIHKALDIKKKIDDTLPKTLTLVQVLSQAAFSADWPFYEYTMFKSQLDKKKVPQQIQDEAFVFIVLDDPSKYNITGDQKKWFEHVKRIHQYRLCDANSYKEIESRLSTLTTTIRNSNLSYIRYVSA